MHDALPRSVTARQAFAVVKKDEVDIARIIELAAAELAERDGRKTAHGSTRHALGDGNPDGRVDGAVGKVRKPLRHLLKREPPRDVGRSEEHTSELQSLMRISYAVFC